MKRCDLIARLNAINHPEVELNTTFFNHPTLPSEERCNPPWILKWIIKGKGQARKLEPKKLQRRSLTIHQELINHE
ncbi:hypothetical protein Thiosp_00925 [Thiorhodovibrio litoralis]|nr:hypothetical protein Thiosp_00925 [Thiorhodovibrio litoralis]